MRRESGATMTATWPVEAPSTGRYTIKSVEAPSARMATLSVEALGASTDVHSHPTVTGSGDGSAVDRSLTSSKTVAADNSGCV